MRTHVLSVMLLVAGTAAAAPAMRWERVPMPALEAARAACVAQLPGELRSLFGQMSARRAGAWSAREQEQWQECQEADRALLDAYAVRQLARDLHRMWERQTGQTAGVAVQQEADALAQTIVRTTREHSRVAKMVGSPLFNNFLIKSGRKSAGFCYHWTKVLVDALQPIATRAFEIQWVTANIGNLTENNGLLVTARQAPMETGLVYDAWRGAGKPYWRMMADDHYHWYIRLTEHQLRMGVADAIEGK